MKYAIERTDKKIVYGRKVQTKGNDEEFPTFELDDGSLLGTHHSHVLYEIKEDGDYENDLDHGRHQCDEHCNCQNDVHVSELGRQDISGQSSSGDVSSSSEP